MSVYAVLRNFATFAARNNVNFKAACACSNYRFYSAKVPQQKIVKEIDPNTGEVKKKKSAIIPKITLLSGEAISVTTLQEAEKLSKRRDLKLVKIVDLDTKTQRPVYKLMTGAEYHAEDLKQREQKKKDRQSSGYIKGEKVLLLNTKISEHDLGTQLNKIVKWLDKMYEVRVVLNAGGSSMEWAEKLYSNIEKFFKDSGSEAKLVQKRQKGVELKFQILPPKKKGDESKNNTL